MNWTTMLTLAAIAGMFAALLMWMEEERRAELVSAPGAAVSLARPAPDGQRISHIP